MRYKAIVSCTDFDGRFFDKGETADLPEGKHSDFLVPLDAPTLAEAASQTPEVVDTEAEAVNEEPEANVQQGATVLFTEDTLKPKTKTELVELAENCFGLALSVKAKESELIAAILDAQATTNE